MSLGTQQTVQDGTLPQQPASGQLLRGSVTQVLSGDTVVIQGQGRPGAPAQEIQVTLTGINAPRLGRPKGYGREGTSDEPFAWEARERLRKLLIGQEVRFSLDPPPGGPVSKAVIAASLADVGGGDDGRQQRKYATVYVRGDNGKPTNVAEILVSEGLVKLACGAARQEILKELIRREEEAKTARVGMHGDESERQAHVRDVKSFIENSTEFLSKYQKTPFKGVVEFVRDGSSVKVSTYSPVHMLFMVEMTGIRSPNVDREGRTEAFANEAVEFTRSRLLHRDVELKIEGIRPNGQTVNATIIHPSGCFEELLLKNGLAKISDTIAKYTGDVEKLRAAEKAAKAKKLGIWKNAESERERSSAQANVKIAQITPPMERVAPRAATVMMQSGQASVGGHPAPRANASNAAQPLNVNRPAPQQPPARGNNNPDFSPSSTSSLPVSPESSVRIPTRLSGSPAVSGPSAARPSPNINRMGQNNAVPDIRQGIGASSGTRSSGSLMQLAVAAWDDAVLTQIDPQAVTAATFGSNPTHMPPAKDLSNVKVHSRPPNTNAASAHVASPASRTSMPHLRASGPQTPAATRYMPYDVAHRTPPGRRGSSYLDEIVSYGSAQPLPAGCHRPPPQQQQQMTQYNNPASPKGSSSKSSGPASVGPPIATNTAGSTARSFGSVAGQSANVAGGRPGYAVAGNQQQYRDGAGAPASAVKQVWPPGGLRK